MKKFIFVLLALLFAFGITQAFAEMSPQTVSGTSYLDNQVYTIAYNNSGSAITSNSIVIIDTSATAGTTLGSYITTDTSGDSNLVFGITDETIAIGKTGRICIRGPHKVLMNSNTGSAAGYQIATSTSAGKAKVSTGTTNLMGTLGQQLAVASDGSDVWWCYLRYATQ